MFQPFMVDSTIGIVVLAGTIILGIFVILLWKIKNTALVAQLNNKREQIAERDTRIEQLEEMNREERAEVGANREEIARLNTSLSEQQKQNDEKLKLLQDAKVTLNNEFKNLATEIFEARQIQFKQQSKEQLTNVLAPLQERIKEFEKRVEQTYNDESKERFSLVKEVQNLQELNTQMAREAINLTNALKGETKTQGTWGEIVLERVLEKSGLQKGREYEIQVSVKDAEGRRFQPDVIVRLPEGKDVIIDSKVSLNAYEKYCSSEDDATRATALKAHVHSLRQHIKTLGEKDYQKVEGIRTLDFVLLFMPIEAAFSLAVQEDPEIFSDAFSRNIMIVSPSTLLATLRTIQNIWRYEQQNKNAEKIAKKAGALYDKFVGFVADLETIGSRLESAQDSYKDAVNKLTSGRGNLVRRAELIKELGAATSKSLPVKLLDDAG